MSAPLSPLLTPSAPPNNLRPQATSTRLPVAPPGTLTQHYNELKDLRNQLFNALLHAVHVAAAGQYDEVTRNKHMHTFMVQAIRLYQASVLKPEIGGIYAEAWRQMDPKVTDLVQSAMNGLYTQNNQQVSFDAPIMDVEFVKAYTNLLKNTKPSQNRNTIGGAGRKPPAKARQARVPAKGRKTVAKGRKAKCSQS